METVEDAAPSTGLRERKKRQTREAIVHVALELFAKRGYGNTTLDDIAAAAGVSRRTIFAYYPSKEDILFQEEPPILLEVERRLRERRTGVSIDDALGDLLITVVPDDNTLLRKQIIGADSSLRRRERVRFARLEAILTPAIARDLGTIPADLRPRMLAASIAGAFHVVYDHAISQTAQGESCDNVGAEAFDLLRDLLHAGIEALADPANTTTDS